jgi:AcrR family transcriptional regulator
MEVFMLENINAKEENKFYKDAFEKTTSDRRQKVLEVAINEFAAKGYNATNINDIIRNSNISTGAMYSYFASKEDLFLTIVNNAYALLEAAYEDIIANSKDLFDCIQRMLVASREYAINYPQLNQIYLDITTQALSQMSVRLSNKIEVIATRLFSRFIEQAKKDGQINKDADGKAIAYCIDNLLMMYQFSFSSDYYKERMKIFLGEDRLNDIEGVEQSIMKFIRLALGVK